MESLGSANIVACIASFRQLFVHQGRRRCLHASTTSPPLLPFPLDAGPLCTAARRCDSRPCCQDGLVER
ncbi:hypothetical protein BJY00DRAFT_293817 [Aspergillus carlsbadensis]|nr:hypothetical protein BJY00DRAFT_293817 [Aspergillus carlsbadensis]